MAPQKLPETWHLYGPDYLPHRILLLSKMIERETSRQLMREFGLSVAQWRVLAFVCSLGPATASHISQAAEIDRAEISRAVRALEQAELVIREFEKNNRKKQTIIPTAQGTALFGKVRQMRRAYFDRICEGLSKAEKLMISEGLGKVAKGVIHHRNSAAAT